MPDDRPFAGPDEPRLSFRAWWMLGILLVFYILSMLDRLVLTMLVDPIRQHLKLSDFEISLILGPAFAVCFAAASFPLGWAADRWPRRSIIFAGVLAWSAATAGAGLANGFVVLLLCRGLVATGEASLQPAAFSLISDSFPRSRLATALGIYGAAPKLGVALSYQIGAMAVVATATAGPQILPLIGTVMPWQMTMILLGAPGVLLAFLAFTFPEPLRRGRQAGSAGKPYGIVRYLRTDGKVMIPLLIGFGVASLGAAALTAWIPTYFSRILGWGPAKYGPWMSVLSLLVATTVPIKGMIVDKLFQRGMLDAHVRFYTWLVMFSIPVLIMAFTVKSPVAFGILYALGSLAGLSQLVYAASAVQILVPNELRGRMSALLLLSITLFSTGFGPPMVGALTDFVLRDEMKLGVAMAIVSVFALTVTLVLLRWSLPSVRRILAAQTQVARQ